MRELPRNLKAEEAVLGSMLIEPIAVEKALLKLNADDFYKTAHKTMFKTMKEVAAEGTEIDVVTLSDKLKNLAIFEDIGGSEYLTNLVEHTITTSNIDHHIKIILDKSATRRNIILADEFLTNQYKDGDDKVTADEFANKLTIVKDKTVDIWSMADLAPEVMDNMEKLAKGDKSVLGIKTGIRVLDDAIGGIRRGQNIIIAGNPSHGKTLLGLNIARNVAVSEDKPVLVISYESLPIELASRVVMSHHKIDENTYKYGNAVDKDYEALYNGCNRSASLKIYIINDMYLTADKLLYRVKAFLREHPDTALIVLDYLQLMPDTKDMRSAGEPDKVAYKSKEVTRIIRSTQVPGLVLSQLNRDNLKRTNKKPIPSDLRSSGQIEQDADIIIFCYREFNLLEDNSPMKILKKNDLELIISKNRDGETGKNLNVYFNGGKKYIGDAEVWK